MPAQLKSGQGHLKSKQASALHAWVSDFKETEINVPGAFELQPSWSTP